MSVKTTGILLDAPRGTLQVDFRATSNAEEMTRFLQDKVGQEVEIILKTRQASKPMRKKGLIADSLTPCASSSYWQVKDDLVSRSFSSF